MNQKEICDMGYFYEAEVAAFANRVRLNVAEILEKTRDSHIGGGYSAIDILSVLYMNVLNVTPDTIEDPNRDIFILSKGHIAASYYTVLAHKGFIPIEDLDYHVADGNVYAGHTRKYHTNGVKGIEMSAGSLGHGANVGLGMAYAKRVQGLDGHVYVLMGDGECNEGSVWEAVMFAAKLRLGNITFIIDRNRLQSYGSDVEVCNMGNIAEKFASFGCDVLDINGHDYSEIYRALMTGRSRNSAAPVVIVANTVKGKGVSFMENRLEWHFKSPNKEQLNIIQKELRKG